MAMFELDESAPDTRLLRLRSPVTTAVISEIPCASKDEVDAAVQRARTAQPSWAALSFRERANYMDRMLEVILDKQDQIMDQVVSETGKARSDAYMMEVFSSCDSLCYYAKNAARLLRPQKHRPHGLMRFAKSVRWEFQPLGVIGLITPWNGPFILTLNQGCQALMAGNTVVAKGSEVTPQSAKLVETLFLEAGLPQDVFQVLLGDGVTGAHLVDADIDKISFTGSVATGKKIGAICGGRLVPCTLELGGKDAMIVCADANLERAAQGAVVGSCMNTGHYCCGTERIYVVESIYERFLELVTVEVEKLRQDPALGYDEDVGAVFWDKQMDIIERHVDTAVEAGAKVLVGGKRNEAQKGLYYLPTLMVDVNHDMEIMQQETFGPILCVMKVRDEQEAIQLANDSDYGLSGTVWTSDDAHALDLAKRMQTGSVCVNDMTLTYGIPVAPFGGVKSSGMGMVNGAIGLRSYTQLKPIIFDKSPNKPLQSAYPRTSERADGMRKFSEFLWRKTPIGRWLS